jgi:hypothetical protein
MYRVTRAPAERHVGKKHGVSIKAPAERHVGKKHGVSIEAPAERYVFADKVVHMTLLWSCRTKLQDIVAYLPAGEVKFTHIF